MLLKVKLTESMAWLVGLETVGNDKQSHRTEVEASAQAGRDRETGDAAWCEGQGDEDRCCLRSYGNLSWAAAWSS